MPAPFPGMDPYLERAGLWKQVHTGLIVEIQTNLARRLRPRYLVAIEQRTFLTLLQGEQLVGEPDVLAVAPQNGPANGESLARQAAALAVAEGPAAYTVELPMPEEIVERYLEVRDAETGEAITVIELLSPSNKQEDRARYERKRLQILGSMTNLIEIDLLRAGRPLPMYGDIPASHYRILISRAWERPRAQALIFNVQNPIPDVPIPLRPGEEEPVLALNQVLHDLYDRAGYDLFIDYHQPPPPPLDEETLAWVRQQLDPMDVQNT
ncbi:MAG: hypothetical protein DCC55_32625 [Chloroflexi bacterium]|nr:MAG: hypothetical protein DCC55_32625 [Chloroflexota bacterium]